ncbi:MAG: hypothetical protein PF692_07500 [Kiritimatiellae bacterium]|jgi:hypothetical protein|nr:hypothetical protein [Kiritimatiellia bacterium]
MLRKILIGILGVMVITNAKAQEYDMATKIEQLKPSGDNFVNADGEIVKLWGVNLVALYPNHEDAVKIADRMADFEMNVARPHHMLRPSRDWVWGSQISALNKYQDNTIDPDEEAWDRFDFLNSELKNRGIYLMFALRWSRSYRPGDVKILKTDAADEKAWVDAMTEQNKRHWKETMDSNKLLPFIDERAALIDERFAKDLLTHKNPYTGLIYAEDPQILTIEMVNEYTSEYTLICGNTLPKYFQDKLTAKWSEFAEANGLENATNIYKVKTAKEIEVRGKFFRDLDEQRFMKMQALCTKYGYKGAITFSNLWRGDANADSSEKFNTYIEDHLYQTPMVMESKDDFTLSKTQSKIKDKPFILGEINISEWGDSAKRDAQYRSLMMLATVAYGSFQDWSGIVWFAWQHGDRNLGADGLGKNLGRIHSLGDMYQDEMNQDYLRTCGIIFRKGFIKPSVEPIAINLDIPTYAKDYNSLMNVANPVAAGWQSIHGFSTSYKNPQLAAKQNNAFWKVAEPQGDILVSDTGEITKNIAQRQLSVSAPMTECFGGFLSDKTPLGLKHLQFENTNGFATVIMVSNDDKTITESENLILSRTYLDDDGNEIDGLKIKIKGLKKPADGKRWYIKLMRPVDVSTALTAFTKSEYFDLVTNESSIILPDNVWYECELLYK